MDRRLRNRILIFLALAGVVAYALVRLSGRQPVSKIAVVEPVRANVTASISTNGKVEPITPYVISAQLNTFIEKVNVSEGQSVKKGQLLMELNVTDAQGQLADARSKLLKAQDDLKVAHAGGKADAAAQASAELSKAVALRDDLQRNHETLERLIKEQAATKDELAQNDLKLTQAQAEVGRLTAVKQEFERGVKLDASQAALQVDQLTSEVRDWEAKVADGRITAPADGTLYSLPARAGAYVKVGDVLGEMADLRKVRVRAFVDEPELGGLEQNQPVKITWDALPERSWTGRTESVPKQVVARQARSVGELLCQVNNDDLKLIPNINVDVRINSKEAKNVLTVPRGTVDAVDGKRYVFVVKPNEFGGKATLEKREIEVGIADATNYEVTRGLKEGEKIALPGDVDLKDGMLVKVVNADTSYIRGRQDAN